ncbi:hypothetical protein [Curtobacterium sp. MCLR17_054]|uniref:hypothetical protein n=1 Tax=Curtobacterium sp. MCLR17_054 TaxID=2175632 RepID=UPI000DB4AA22|nr:hypothetical protein [Curtobacterium sp. MCLR17_054]WIE70355.1 hypothetical protein DEJ08_018895 [Curtobacterium sp. MCLR17_054]
MTVDLGDLLLRAVVGTAGLGAVVAIVRAVYIVLSERGPRRRVEAIKFAQETLATLPPDAELRKFVEVQRDRELAALGSAMARAQKRSKLWRSIADNRRRLIAAAVASSAAILAGVSVASWAPPLLAVADSGFYEGLTAFISVAGSALGVAVSLLASRRARRNRTSVTFEGWGLDPTAVEMAIRLLAEDGTKHEKEDDSQGEPGK